MFETIRWKADADLYFMGRNGMGKCTGVEVMHSDWPKEGGGKIVLTPITSRNQIANCAITVPVRLIPELIELLKEAAKGI